MQTKQAMYFTFEAWKRTSTRPNRSAKSSDLTNEKKRRNRKVCLEFQTQNRQLDSE